MNKKTLKSQSPKSWKSSAKIKSSGTYQSSNYQNTLSEKKSDQVKTMREKQNKILDREFGLLANKANLKELEAKKIKKIRNKIKAKGEKFKEQLLKNEDEIKYKNFKKEKTNKRIMDNQKQLKNSQMMTARTIFQSFMSQPKSEPKAMSPRPASVQHFKDSDDEALEDYDNKHYRAMAHKAQNYLRTIQRIADANTEKEEKARRIREQNSLKENDLTGIISMIKKQK